MRGRAREGQVSGQGGAAKDPADVTVVVYLERRIFVEKSGGRTG